MMFFILLACFVAVHGSGVNQQVRRPQPYSFGYTIRDKQSIQHRQEAGNGAGVVQRNYGFVDNKGIQRQVDYVADNGGFRAQVKTNEPGTVNQSPAAVRLLSNDPYAQGGVNLYQSRPNIPFVPGLYISNPVYGLPTVRNFQQFIPGAQGPGYYQGGSSYNNVYGAGYQQPTIYFGGNLLGGRITGYETRFTK